MPAATQSSSAPPMSECARMCTTQFNCLNGPVVNACEANCQGLLDRGKVSPLCGVAAGNNLKCLSTLDCSQWTDFARGQVSGAEKYPCVDEELRNYIYCSGTPEAVSCANNCIAKGQCEPDATDLDTCARQCVRDLRRQGAMYGAKCWNAFVMLNICSQPLSCSARRSLGKAGASSCMTEWAAVQEACR